MSMALHPGEIRDLLITLDQDIRSPQPLATVVTRALRHLLEIWPSTEFVRVYQPNLELLASTDGAQTTTFPDRALQDSVPANEDGIWLIPMMAGGQRQGMLEVKIDDPDAEAWLQLVATSLAQSMMHQEVITQFDETRRLNDLNQSIIGAEDALAVLRALRKLTANASRILHLLLTYDDEGRIEDIIVQHVLNRDQAQAVQQPLAEFDGAATIEVTKEFWQHPPQASVFINNTAAPPDDFPQAMAAAAQYVGIGSTVLIPIFQGDRVREIVDIAFPAPQLFNTHTRRLYDAARDQIVVVLQSLRLIHETRRNTSHLMEQVAILQSLSDLSTVIGIAQDEQQLLHQSAQALVSALKVDYCWVATLDSSQERGTVFCEYPHRGKTGQPFTIGELPITTQPSPDNPLPIVVNEVRSDLRVNEKSREILTNDNVEAFMLLPVFVRGLLAGLIRLDIREATRKFTPEMQEVAQTILSQVVVGLQNIRLLEETQRRSEQLQRINHFGQTLQSTLEMPIILESALQESREMLSIERMSIALYDYESEQLRTAALYANGEHYVTPANGAEVEMDGSVVGRAWHSRALVHIPDMMTEIGHTSDEIPELRSLLVLPLITRAGVMGVVSVGQRQPHAYSETDIIVFQQMMTQFAAAIENAILYERTQRIARREALMNEISGRLQGTSSVETALTEAARSLQQVLGTERVSIRLGAPPSVTNGKDGGA